MLMDSLFKEDAPVLLSLHLKMMRAIDPSTWNQTSIQAKTLSQEKHRVSLTIQIALLLVYNRKQFHVYQRLHVDRQLHQLRLFVKAHHFLTLGLLILP